MGKTFKVGTKVYCLREHPDAIGEVIRIMPRGLQIEWTAPPSPTLPFGCINLELWVYADLHLLRVIGEERLPHSS